MPTLQTIGNYRIIMHTGREHPPPHVHVVTDDADVVVNLLTLQPFGEVSFRVPKAVRDYLQENQETLLESWDDYHGQGN